MEEGPNTSSDEHASAWIVKGFFLLALCAGIAVLCPLAISEQQGSVNSDPIEP